MFTTEKFKERITNELDEMLECETWDGTKLHWVYELSKIMNMIHQMEVATSDEPSNFKQR